MSNVPAGYAAGRFVPEVKIILEEESDVAGVWHQKFEMIDPAFPNDGKLSDYVGEKYDLADPDTLAYLWDQYPEQQGGDNDSSSGGDE